jgi:hypothetical protein
MVGVHAVKETNKAREFQNIYSERSQICRRLQGVAKGRVFTGFIYRAASFW